MDNRFRFLYSMASEMWGHRREARAGNGETGASAAAAWEENPPWEGEGVKRSEHKGSEACREAVGKSRYRVPWTRTVNRHRWMRRES